MHGTKYWNKFPKPDTKSVSSWGESNSEVLCENGKIISK